MPETDVIDEFVGKTVQRVVVTGERWIDIWFTDGSKYEIEADIVYGWADSSPILEVTKS